MKEIGSFIELELPRGRELFKGETDVARLNSGRAAIWHAYRVLDERNVNDGSDGSDGLKGIWIPYYQCETVREFLTKKGVCIKYYHQDRNFNPTDLYPKEDEAVLLVNYYGIMSGLRMKELCAGLKNVIVDNCQAFFCEPIEGALNVYSARKFNGVADGAYVVGKDAHKFVEEYPRCCSSDTALFLLKRIEYGCEGEGYKSRTVNEARVDSEDVMKMSKLTRAMLDGADYDNNRKRRRDNFDYACGLFADINKMDPVGYYDEKTVPMVYPLAVEDDTLLGKLLAAGHFQGHWWKYICDELPEDTFEHWLSRYMIPITIDQRYGSEELEYINRIIRNL